MSGFSATGFEISPLPVILPDVSTVDSPPPPPPEVVDEDISYLPPPIALIEIPPTPSKVFLTSL